jgi:hypothetical protein
VTDPRAGAEAARLLAAAQDWLRTSAPHLAPVADDGQPCSCPVCRAVAGLREADPDSVARWVDTAVATLGSLVAQAGDLAAKAAATDEAADPDDAGDEVHDLEDLDDDGDEHATALGEEGTGADDARQDGASPRRVRRITLEPKDEDGRQDR